MEGMKFILGPGAVSIEAGRLSRRLDRLVRDCDQDGITAALVAAVSGRDGVTVRHAVLALAGSMIRYADRRANLVLLYGGVGKHLRLAAAADHLTDWAMELYTSAASTRRDAESVAELTDQLWELPGTGREMGALRTAASAMAEFAVPSGQAQQAA